MPRRTKLTPDVVEALTSAVRAGLPIKHAALRAGVSDRSVFSWLQRGRECKGGKHADFLRAMERAQADSVAILVAKVAQAADTDWRAASWLLTRRAPAEFMDPGKRAELMAAEARAQVAQAEAGQRVRYIEARARLLEDKGGR